MGTTLFQLDLQHTQAPPRVWECACEIERASPYPATAALLTLQLGYTVCQIVKSKVMRVMQNPVFITQPHVYIDLDKLY